MGHRWKQGICVVCGIAKSVAYAKTMFGVVPCGKTAEQWFGIEATKDSAP